MIGVDEAVFVGGPYDKKVLHCPSKVQQWSLKAFKDEDGDLIPFSKDQVYLLRTGELAEIEVHYVRGDDGRMYYK